MMKKGWAGIYTLRDRTIMCRHDFQPTTVPTRDRRNTLHVVCLKCSLLVRVDSDDLDALALIAERIREIQTLH